MLSYRSSRCAGHLLRNTCIDLKMTVGASYRDKTFHSYYGYRHHFSKFADKRIVKPAALTMSTKCMNNVSGSRLKLKDNTPFSTMYHQIRYSSSSESINRRKWIMRMVMLSWGMGGVLFVLFIYKYFVRDIGGDKCSILGLKRPKMMKYQNVVLPILLKTTMPEIEKFSVRPDDIFVVSYPRSGLTWLQEIVYLIQTNDFQRANDIRVDKRIPYLEYTEQSDLDEAPSPRLIRSHLPLELLPAELGETKAKVVYIARNAKDVAFSYYSVIKILSQVVKYSGSLDSFCQLFCQHKVAYGSWPAHVLSFWNKSNEESNILFLKYEDLHRDFEGTIQQIANFLGKKLSNEQVQRIKEHCSFDNMKNNKSVNFNMFEGFGVPDKVAKDFIRNGKVGEWVGNLSDESIKKLDVMIALNLKGKGLFFDYGGTKSTAQDFYGS